MLFKYCFSYCFTKVNNKYLTPVQKSTEKPTYVNRNSDKEKLFYVLVPSKMSVIFDLRTKTHAV